ncbi:MAG TPA: cytochrome c oxidase subunit II [Gemmatimonadaceae bacterium]|nr:cytochrome c oxidase subunit II [Gemmatimonadaceae bacterium]
MPFHLRLRRPGTRKAGAAALTVGFALLLAACGQNYPNSIFHQRTDFNRDVDFLFKILIYAGTAVFIFVEAILVWTLIKYRHRPGRPDPEHVHGNTTLEITWTVIPLFILVLIGFPTVKTIFKTQAKARADALQVEVIGHQWWWEFRYPQYNVVTANELYLPLGRTVNFTLKTQDVIHSFWVPALAGKRDLVSNHTNYLWYTPDSTTATAFNGACVEYCGASHANMRFKTFTVSPADFESWAAHQSTAAIGTSPTAPAPGGAPGAAAAVAPTTAPGAAAPTTASAAAVAQQPATPPVTTPVVQAGFIAFPREQMPAYTVPQTPLPAGLNFDDNLLGKGDPANGAKLVVGQGGCLGCHTIKGNPMMVGVIGPNLTHIATRTTIAAGLYPNDERHLARWIKNAPVMKPGVYMLTEGAGEYDPVRHMKSPTNLTDQQIADIVAYLQTLK